MHPVTRAPRIVDALRHLATLVLFVMLPAVAAAAPLGYAPDYSVERSSSAYAIQADGTHTRDFDIQYRVLTARGISRIGSVSVGYVEGRDTVESIEAWTILPDGTRLPVSPDRIRDREEDNSAGAMNFSDLRYKIIVFPRVEVGGAVAYRARIRRHQSPYPGEFQHSIFTLGSLPYQQMEVRFSLPEQRTLHIDQRGFAGGLERTEAGINHFLIRRRPPGTTPPEVGQASPVHPADYLQASTMPDMRSIGRLLQPGFEAGGRVTDEIRAHAQRLVQGLHTERDKAAAIHAWVARNIRYVSVSLGDGHLAPHPASQVLKNRYGDCKDHAVLLQALLAAVGIASSPAFIGTGPAFTFAKIGVHHPLDHVITYLPGLDLYVDSTDRFAPLGTLSDTLADKPVILSALGRVARTPANTAEVNTTRTEVTMRIRRDGSIEGESVVRKTGDEEVSLRQVRFGSTDRDPEAVVTDLLSRYNETGTGELDFPDPLDLQTPFINKARFVLDPPAAMPGRGAIRVPVGIAPGDLEGYASTRPLVSARKPFACSSQTVSERYRITFPDNVRIESIPKGVRFEDGDIRYVSRYTRQGRTVLSERELVVRRKSPLCDREQTASWVRFHPVVRGDVRGLVFYR